MTRTTRTHAPGAGIHLTARIQGRAALFNPELRDHIADFITEAARPCGHQVLALAVMPNHIHIVLKQAQLPLGWMMQRVMQRAMRLVKRAHHVDGHVFGGPYWSAVCANVTYLRQAIIYTHLNPWKADLCADASSPGTYRWSTHNQCMAQTADVPWASRVASDVTRLLFADDSLDPESVTRNYERFIRYWMKRHRLAVPGDKYIFTPPTEDPPRARLGDEYWASNYTQTNLSLRPAIAQVDVRDRAIQVLRRLEPDCTIDMLRHAGRVRQLCRIRREVIAALLIYGYRGSAIARCLRVSHSVVCDVASKLRIGSESA